MADVRIADDWKAILGDEFSKPYFEELVKFVKQEYAAGVVYPAGRDIFRAFDKCKFDDLKVVIIGQDPYHGPGQANGLCFSVNDGVQFPPSLQNIFKEVASDTGVPMPISGNLDRWAEQGVLLLNAVLTVRAHNAASHAGRGWEQFTDAVIRYISDNCNGVVFMLWGNFARGKRGLIDSSRHCVLEAAHPSPLARGAFFGCRHFSKANAYLQACGRKPIDWKL
jgi:uracil-DNA glycosylase